MKTDQGGIKLRWYQEQAVSAALRNLKDVPKQLLCLPTGSGKAILTAEIPRRILDKNTRARVLILAHRKELVRQNFEKIVSINPMLPSGIYSAGLKKKQSYAPILFAGIQSVYSALKKDENALGHRDLVIIDEAHMISDKEGAGFKFVIDVLQKINPSLRVIGLTATPYRLDSGHLIESGIFDEITYDLCGKESFARLIFEGFLAPLVAPSISSVIDRRDIKMVAGEFSELGVSEQVQKKAVDICNEVFSLAHDRNKIIVFCRGIKDCELFYSLMQGQGYDTFIAHSKMPTDDADIAIQDFKDAKRAILISADKLTTGFDAPDIDCIVCARPTTSVALWVQILGRGTRPYPGKKNCLVLDFGSNAEELGTIDEPLVKSVKPKKKKEEEFVDDVESLTICVSCGIYYNRRGKVCPNCGTAKAEEYSMENLHSKCCVSSVMVSSKISCMSVDSVSAMPYVSKAGKSMFKVVYKCGWRYVDRYVFSEADAKRIINYPPDVITLDESGRYPKFLSEI